MVFLFYTIYSFVTDFSITFLSYKKILTDTTYYLLISCFTIIEFLTFSYFFYNITSNNIFKKGIFVSVFIFIPLCIVNYFLQKNSYTNIDTIPVTFQALLFMLLSVHYLFEQIKQPKTLFIYTTFEFWAVTGILIYLAGTFFIYLLSSNLSEKEFLKFWFINYVFNIQKNIFLIISFSFFKKKSSVNSSDPDEIHFNLEY